MKTKELTHAETIVETNSKTGHTLNRPKYGHRWSINAPHPREGWTTTLYIGGEHGIRAMWNAHYSNRYEEWPPVGGGHFNDGMW